MAVASRKKKKKSNKSQKTETAQLEVVKKEVVADVDVVEKQYLNLLKSALVNVIYPEHALQVQYLEDCVSGKTKYNKNVFLNVIQLVGGTFSRFVESQKSGVGFHGRAVRFAHTKIGVTRLDNIESCAKDIFEHSVPGDFVEAGVWQGGASIFMRALQKIYKEESRSVWLCDSFKGVPVELESEVDKKHKFQRNLFPEFAVNAAIVKKNFLTYDVLDENVKFVEGWFKDTLPDAPIEQIALLRVDAVLYDSTSEVLKNLYDKVSPGGYVIVDGYHLSKPCQKAVDEFRKEHKITEPLHNADVSCVYWQKK